MSATTRATASCVAGCELQPIGDSEICQRWLGWVAGERDDAPSIDAKGLRWALAHCNGGVTWGHFDAGKSVWHLGCQAVPDVSPPIRKDTLQELRLFGEPGEVLVWRTEAGLRGRILREREPAADRADEADPLRPSDELRILRGDDVCATVEHGFAHVVDRTGAEQVVPADITAEHLRVPRIHLRVRHYWEQDAETGAVRIAATRLVDLVTEDRS